MDLFVNPTAPIVRSQYGEAMVDNARGDSKISGKPRSNEIPPDPYQTLDRARSIFAKDYFIRPRSPDRVLLQQSKSSPAQPPPTPPSPVRQYNSETTRKSNSPSKLPIPRSSNIPSLKQTIEVTLQRSKTLPPKRSRGSLPTTVKLPGEKVTKPAFLYNPSTINERPCTSLHAAFAEPEEVLMEEDSKLSPATQPRGPILLTQLRAERHKHIDASAKSNAATVCKGRVKRKSGPITTPTSDRSSITSLFTDSPDSGDRKKTTGKLQLRTNQDVKSRPTYMGDYRTPTVSPIRTDSSSDSCFTSDRLRNQAQQSSVSDLEVKRSRQTKVERQQPLYHETELPNWPAVITSSAANHYAKEVKTQSLRSGKTSGGSFIECSFIGDDEHSSQTTLGSAEILNQLGMMDNQACSSEIAGNRRRQASALSRVTDCSLNTVRATLNRSESVNSTPSDVTAPFPEMNQSQEDDMDWSSFVEDTDDISINFNTTRNDVGMSVNLPRPDEGKRSQPLQQIPPFAVRCLACRAEAQHQQTVSGKENENGKPVKLYSEAIKSRNISSSAIPEQHNTPAMSKACSRNCSRNLDPKTGDIIRAKSGATAGTTHGNEGNDKCSQDTGKGKGLSPSNSLLRAEAASFVPVWAKGSSNSSKINVGTWEELANMSYNQYGPQNFQLLTPNMPEVDASNGLQLAMPNHDVDMSIYQSVYQGPFHMSNYVIEDDANMLNRYPFCTTSPRLWTDNHVFGNQEYKINTVNPKQVAGFNRNAKKCHQASAKQAESTGASETDSDKTVQAWSKESPPKESTPRRLSIGTLKKLEDTHSTRLMTAAIAEQSRRIVDGPGPYPHTLPDATRPITEKMWMPPIGPGHRYTGQNVLPNPRSREWYELSRAIELLNLEFAEKDARSQKWWEPPIPMGFDARARFTQPPSQAQALGGSLRGGFKKEFDWINIPVIGCKYCGHDQHLATDCPLRENHKSAGEHCMNCNGMDHFLRDCTSPPTFDDTDSRARKLQFYAHTEHWRRTLHQQHALFAPKAGISNYPRNLPPADLGDASLTFSWLNCSPCKPSSHWDAIQENIKIAKDQAATYHRDDNIAEYWKEANWLLEYQNCPVVWNIVHRDYPTVSWAVFNPLGSVAVDAFWRTGIKAMGWDGPCLPDGSVV